MLIGEKIRDLRTKKNLTQADLAQKCGLNRNSIYKYEKNITVPKIEQLRKIADILDVSLAEFLPEEYGALYGDLDKTEVNLALQGEIDAFELNILENATNAAEEIFLSKVSQISDKQIEKEIIDVFRFMNRLGKWKILEFVISIERNPHYRNEEKYEVYQSKLWEEDQQNLKRILDQKNQ